MMKDFIQLFKLGKKLGLSKKDINRVLIFDNSKHTILYKCLLIISVIFFGVLIVLFGIEASRNTYASGTFYSTVHIKDFNPEN